MLRIFYFRIEISYNEYDASQVDTNTTTNKRVRKKDSADITHIKHGVVDVSLKDENRKLRENIEQIKSEKDLLKKAFVSMTGRSQPDDAKPEGNIGAIMRVPWPHEKKTFDAVVIGWNTTSRAYKVLYLEPEESAFEMDDVAPGEFTWV